MATTYEFEVFKVPVAVGKHSYEFEDKATGVRHPLPRGGDNDLAGKYPEIEEYLLAQYGVTAKLVFLSRFDSFNYRPGGATFTFVRDAGNIVVLVHDINRTFFSMTITYPADPTI